MQHLLGLHQFRESGAELSTVPQGLCTYCPLCMVLRRVKEANPQAHAACRVPVTQLRVIGPSPPFLGYRFGKNGRCALCLHPFF